VRGGRTWVYQHLREGRPFGDPDDKGRFGYVGGLPLSCPWRALGVGVELLVQGCLLWVA
jgi:hypothetical protein